MSPVCFPVSGGPIPFAAITARIAPLPSSSLLLHILMEGLPLHRFELVVLASPRFPCSLASLFCLVRSETRIRFVDLLRSIILTRHAPHSSRPLITSASALHAFCSFQVPLMELRACGSIRFYWVRARRALAWQPSLEVRWCSTTDDEPDTREAS